MSLIYWSSTYYYEKGVWDLGMYVVVMLFSQTESNYFSLRLLFIISVKIEY